MCMTVVEVLRPTAHNKNVTLAFESSQTSYIWGDAERLSQILWNVIDNAIKTTGTHRVSVKLHPEVSAAVDIEVLAI